MGNDGYNGFVLTGKRLVFKEEAGTLKSKHIRGIVFDMDGTMTVPVYDFPHMRRVFGLEPDQDLFSGIRALQAEHRAIAERKMLEFEEEGLKAMRVNPGFHDIMEFLESHGFPKAILTRNTHYSVTHFLENHAQSYQFSPVITRSSELPIKPSPEPLLHISKTWEIPIDEILMVGDGPEDMLCAQNAGAMCCLVKTKDNTHLKIASDIAISNLAELYEMLHVLH